MASYTVTLEDLIPEHARDEIVKLLLDTAAAHKRMGLLKTGNEKFIDQISENVLTQAAETIRSVRFVKRLEEITRRNK